MLKFYWDIGVRQHWTLLAVIVAIALVAPFFQAANLGMVIPIVTLLMGEAVDLQNMPLPLVSDLAPLLRNIPKVQMLVGLVVVMAALLIGKNLLTIVRCYVTMRLLTFVQLAVMRRQFYGFLGATYERQINQPTGSTLHQMWDSPLHVAETIRAGSELLANSLQVLGLLVLMAWISWKLTLLTAVMTAIAALVFDRGFRRPLQAISANNYAISSRTMALLTDVMAGVRQIKAHVAEPQVRMRFEQLAADIDRDFARHARLRYWPAPLNELFFIGLLAILYGLTSTVRQLHMDVSYFAAFMLAMTRLGPAFNAITEAQVSLHTASKSVQESREFLANWTPEDDHGRLPTPACIAELSFNQVSFTYPSRPGNPVLHELCLSFRVGQITAVVGASGAGKSTLADLVIRLFSPLKGSIEADGIDIRQFDLASWRRQVGFVSQDTFLFNASVRDNIALSYPEATQDAVVEASRLAHIHEFILSLPEGYETIVGDRGVKLSGGQRQRIAIARALLSSPKILVFDEATSALDNISERIVQETINELRIGRIVIVIAHRLSTIAHADNIVVLDHGRVAEQGTHRFLIQQHATYAKLYSQVSEERSGGPN